MKQKSRKFINLGILLLGILLINSCENYKSKFPITSFPGTEIDLNIESKWILLDSSQTPYRVMAQLRIYNWEKGEYLALVDYYGINNRSSVQSPPYKFWESKMKDTRYINYVNLENPQVYQFLKYEQIGSKLNCSFLDKNYSFIPNSQRELKEHIVSNQLTFDTSFNQSVILHDLNSLEWKNLSYQKIDKVYKLKKPRKEMKKNNGKYKIEYSYELESLTIDNYREQIKSEVPVDSFLNSIGTYKLKLGKSIGFKKPHSNYCLIGEDEEVIILKMNENKIEDITNDVYYKKN